MSVTYPFGERKYDGAIEFDLYEKVARLNADNVEEIFNLLQNWNEPWSENSEIEALTYHTRSMSVGDIVLNKNTGEYSVVASIGFDPVTDENLINYLKEKGE